VLGAFEAAHGLVGGGWSPGRQALVGAIRVLTIGLYFLIAVVGLSPELPEKLGIEMDPLAVEAVLVTAMIVLGANFVWLSFFKEAARAEGGRPG